MDCVRISDNDTFCSVAKTLRTNQKSVKFVKDASIFDDWKEETPQDTARALKHDFSLWKLEKIVPEESEQEKVKEIIIKHYFNLRGIFIQACVASADLPDMSRRTFGNFVQQAKIVDGVLTMGIVDTYFKAANFEEEDQENNDDNQLVRFEFLEMLVRIAKGKFIDFGSMSSVSEALKRLLEKYVLPMEHKLIPW